jgi:hypothetical protein
MPIQHIIALAAQVKENNAAGWIIRVLFGLSTFYEINL